MKKLPKKKPVVQKLVHSLKEEFRREERNLHHDLEYIKKHLDKLWEHVAQTNERLTDLEVQSNLIARLLTTLCIEKLKIPSDALGKLIKRLEQETIEDSQIMHLEQLYSLEHKDEKHSKARKPKS